MARLVEVLAVRQIPGEQHRRWFGSDDLDLIVWYEPSGAPSAFQLCYDKSRGERALTWRPNEGLHHMAVDDGEDVEFKWKGTPILVPDGGFDPHRLRQRFLEASAGMPTEIVAFVAARLVG